MLGGDRGLLVDRGPLNIEAKLGSRTRQSVLFIMNRRLRSTVNHQDNISLFMTQARQPSSERIMLHFGFPRPPLSRPQSSPRAALPLEGLPCLEYEVVVGAKKHNPTLAGRHEITACRMANSAKNPCFCTLPGDKTDASLLRAGLTPEGSRSGAGVAGPPLEAGM